MLNHYRMMTQSAGSLSKMTKNMHPRGNQQQMLQQQQDISDRMDIAELRREQDLARAQNLRVADRTVQLTPLPHVTHPGVATPPGFPATADALRDLPGQVLHNVMVAYGLVPVPHLIAARITQLAVFIGVDRLVG